ncbi:Protein of unknown function, partial [Gryllus bimaculatus]
NPACAVTRPCAHDGVARGARWRAWRGGGARRWRAVARGRGARWRALARGGARCGVRAVARGGASARGARVARWARGGGAVARGARGRGGAVGRAGAGREWREVARGARVREVGAPVAREVGAVARQVARGCARWREVARVARVRSALRVQAESPKRGTRGSPHTRTEGRRGSVQAVLCVSGSGNTRSPAERSCEGSGPITRLAAGGRPPGTPATNPSTPSPNLSLSRSPPHLALLALPSTPAIAIPPQPVRLHHARPTVSLATARACHPAIATPLRPSLPPPALALAAADAPRQLGLRRNSTASSSPSVTRRRATLSGGWGRVYGGRNEISEKLLLNSILDKQNNAEIKKELKVEPLLKKLEGNKRRCEHLGRTPDNGLPALAEDCRWSGRREILISDLIQFNSPTLYVCMYLARQPVNGLRPTGNVLASRPSVKGFDQIIEMQLLLCCTLDSKAVLIGASPTRCETALRSGESSVIRSEAAKFIRTIEFEYSSLYSTYLLSLYMKYISRRKKGGTGYFCYIQYNWKLFQHRQRGRVIDRVIDPRKLTWKPLLICSKEHQAITFLGYNYSYLSFLGKTNYYFKFIPDFAEDAYQNFYFKKLEKTCSSTKQH